MLPDRKNRTIYESFIRKYTALSGVKSDLMRHSHKFTPVTIGQTLRLSGASFNFFYTLHSIPCVGFEVTKVLVFVLQWFVPSSIITT